jgi:hypothetical protein
VNIYFAHIKNNKFFFFFAVHFLCNYRLTSAKTLHLPSPFFLVISIPTMKVLQESIKMDAIAQLRQGRSVREVSRSLHISIGMVFKIRKQDKKNIPVGKKVDFQRFPRPPRPILQGNTHVENF